MTEKKLTGDLPIHSAGQDVLGLQPFAETIARALHQMAPAEGFVVALNAPWGSGKTSAVNLIERHLAVLDLMPLTKKSGPELAELAAASANSPDPAEQKQVQYWTNLARQHEARRETIVVHFNPWYFSGQESIFKAFFATLNVALSKSVNPAVAAAARAFIRRAPEAMAAVGTVGGVATAGPLGAGFGGSIGGLLGMFLVDRKSKIDQLDNTYMTLVRALQESDQRIVVIVDDIDRLMPEETRQVLTLLKSLGSLPRVTYLVPYDRVEVAELLRLAKICNADYLDKIVQASFDLPTAERRQLQAYFGSKIDIILDGQLVNPQERWQRAYLDCVDPYLLTPRHVGQLTNSMQVIWPAVGSEVDWSDMVVLQTLRLHEYPIYGLLLSNLGQLTGERVTFSDDTEWAKPFESGLIGARNSGAARNALTYLFPRLAKALKSSSSRGGDYSAAGRERRISSPEYARNYFVLSPAPDQFSASAIAMPFNSVTPNLAFAELLKSAREKKTKTGLTMVSRLLDQMKEEVSGRSRVSPELVKAMLAQSQAMFDPMDAEAPLLFTVDNRLRFDWFLVEALRRVPLANRANEVRSWMSGTTGIIAILPLIETLTGKDATNTVDEVIPTEDHAALRADIAEVARQASAEPELLQSLNSGRYLFAWARLTDKPTVAAWLRGQLGDESKLATLAKLMLSTEQPLGGPAQSYFEKKGWATLLDVDEFADRLASYKSSLNPGSPELESITNFDEALRRADSEASV